MKIYDISVPLSGDIPVYPGDPPVIIEPALLIDKGDSSNVFRLFLSTHAGTHIDAPRHMLSHGVTVDHLCLSQFVHSERSGFCRRARGRSAP